MAKRKRVLLGDAINTLTEIRREENRLDFEEALMGPIPLGLKQLAYYRGRNGALAIIDIVRYTATQVVTKRTPDSPEVRFNLKTGFMVGASDPYYHRVRPVTADVHDEIARYALEADIQSHGYKLEELGRKLAHTDRTGMSTAAMESRVAKLKVAVIAVQSMINIEPSEER